MKKIISTLASLFIAVFVMAQVPDIMNYQAVARNNSGQALASQTIKVRLSIIKNAVSQYSETRQVTTNALGLFNVQIGSTGALSTTGSFNAINWQNNAAPGYVLKVELDINNSGLFTDMGNQALVTVPYAFASKTANETVNIAGRPIDQTTTPTAGSRLSWNGSSWTPVKKDAVIKFVGPIPEIGAIAGNPWQWVGPTTSITVTGTETIVAHITAVIGHTTSQPNGYFDVSVCYRNASNGTILNVGGEGAQQNIYFTPSKIMVPLVNTFVLPAGTYQIGMGIRHGSTVASGTHLLDWNDVITGVIEVKY